MMPHNTPDKNSSIALAIVVLTGLNLAIHYLHCPVWVAFATGFCFSWRIAYSFGYLPLPGRVTRNIIYISCFVGLFLTQKTFIGLEAGLNSLTLAAGMKLLEADRYGDYMNSCFICLLLLMGKLLYSQSFLMTIFLIADVAAVTALMYKLNSRDYGSNTFLKSMKPSLKLMMWAAPLIVFLFIFFPRIPSRFIPAPLKDSYQVGFSDQLDPGKVSELAGSNQLAFRVKFPNGQSLAPSQLYWRGAVLEQGKGMSWRKVPLPHQELFPQRISPFRASSKKILQSIIIEPTFRNWLFALDTPMKVDFQDTKVQRLLKHQRNHTFELTKDLFKRSIYTAVSAPKITYRELRPRDRKRNIKLNLQTREPKLRDLVEQWKSESASMDEIPKRAMQYFKSEGFSYTLKPGAMVSNSVSEFIFEKKRGFCEHYAAAFTTMMRMAGVPARIIVGFQGGRYNQFDGYYSVTSRDAHAWSEVWSEQQKQWVRFDPTSVVAPERIQLGGQDFQDLNTENISSQSAIEELRAKSNLGLFGFLKKVRLFGDAMTNRWNLFLLNYDLSYQTQVLKSFGLGDIPVSTWFIAMIAVVFIFGVIMILKGFRANSKNDPLYNMFRKLTRTLKPHGVSLQTSDGPVDFFDRAVQHLPKASEHLEKFSVTYLQARYVHDRYDKTTTDRLKNLNKSIKKKLKE